MKQVRLTLQDHYIVTLPLREAAFGLDTDTLSAHGPVIRATLGEWAGNDDAEDRDLGRPKNRAERSAAA